MFKSQKQARMMMKHLPKVAAKMMGEMPMEQKASTESKTASDYHRKNLTPFFRGKL